MNPLEFLTNDQKPVVIFELNTKLSKKKELGLVIGRLDIGVTQAQGCYKNVLNTCYVAITKTPKDIEAVFTLAGEHNQESVLVIDDRREAFLYYLNSETVEHIGTLETTSAADAMDNYTGWTRRGSTFYICK